MANELELAYQAEYQKKKIRQFSLSLNRDHDAEIIDWLEEQKPFVKYVRNLIIKDMRKNGIDIADREDGRVKSGFYTDWRKNHSTKA